MMIGTPKAGTPQSPAAPVETGMRRVSWVRIVLDDHGPRCQVLGVGHRLPNARPISLDTALALAAAGVPTVVRSVDGSDRLLSTG